jgi:hypothetical protein
MLTCLGKGGSEINLGGGEDMRGEIEGRRRKGGVKRK